MSDKDVADLAMRIQNTEFTNTKVKLILDFLKQHENNASFAETGLNLLATWATGDDHINLTVHIVNENGISVTLDLMELHQQNANVQMLGIKTLGAMAQNPAIGKQIAEAQGVSKIVQSMKRQDDPAIYEVGLLALQNLCVDRTAKTCALADEVLYFSRPLCHSAIPTINTLACTVCFLLENDMEALLSQQIEGS